MNKPNDASHVAEKERFIDVNNEHAKLARLKYKSDQIIIQKKVKSSN